MGERSSEPSPVEQIFADPPTEEELAAAESKRASYQQKRNGFLFLEGFSELNMYLVQRRALLALPLVLAFHRRQAMKQKRLIALVPELWKDAGDPPRHMRETMLKHLRRMPDLIRIHRANSLTIHYLLERGPVWREFRVMARKKNASGEIDDGGVYDNLDEE